MSDGVATITLNRPERKNPLTLESYRELTDTFLALQHVNDAKAVMITGAGQNFSSGGDVHDIIGRLVEMKQAGDARGLLAFTQMTGDLMLLGEIPEDPAVSEAVRHFLPVIEAAPASSASM